MPYSNLDKVLIFFHEQVVLCPPFFDPLLVSQDLDTVQGLGTGEDPYVTAYIDDYRFAAGLLIEALCTCRLQYPFLGSINTS